SRRDAEAGGDFTTAREIVRLEGASNPLANPLGSCGTRVWQQDEELFASPSAEQIHRAETTARDFAKNGEHVIACSVAVAIVDRLEVIEVGHDQCESVPVASGALQFHVSSVIEAQAIERQCQGVDRGLLLKCVLKKLSLGDVVKTGDEKVRLRRGTAGRPK